MLPMSRLIDRSRVPRRERTVREPHVMLRAVTTTATLLVLLAGCGNDANEQPTLSSSLRSEVAEDKSPETLTRLATYLQEHPEVEIDPDLRDETATLLVENMAAVRKSIADPGSPTSLKADPEALLRVAIQVEKDDTAAEAVLSAVTTSSIDEVDEATKAYVTSRQGPGDDGRFESSLADSSRSSGALATALGVDTYETEADAVDVFAYLVDQKRPTDLVAGVPLTARTIIASNYLNAPADTLTGAVAERPRYDETGVIDAIYKWEESDSSPIPLGNVSGFSEYAENQWSNGEELAIAARK